MAKQNTLKGRLVYKQFIVLDDGSEVRVRYNQNKDLYKGTDVQVYEYEAKEGTGENAKVVTRYAVPFDQAIRANRVSVSDKIKSLRAQGLTAEDILAMFE